MVAHQSGDQGALLTFCEALPKVELHAHLHGSIRNDTVLDLLETKAAEQPELLKYRQ